MLASWASLGKFWQKSFAPLNVCLLLHLWPLETGGELCYKQISHLHNSESCISFCNDFNMLLSRLRTETKGSRWFIVIIRPTKIKIHK